MLTTWILNDSAGAQPICWATGLCRADYFLLGGGATKSVILALLSIAWSAVALTAGSNGNQPITGLNVVASSSFVAISAGLAVGKSRRLRQFQHGHLAVCEQRIHIDALGHHDGVCIGKRSGLLALRLRRDSVRWTPQRVALGLGLRSRFSLQHKHWRIA